MRNLFKYSKLYAGHDPKLIEGGIFRFELELDEGTPQATPQVTPQATPQAESYMAPLLSFCRLPRTREEIGEHLGLKDRKHLRTEILQPLLDARLLVMTLPDKPTSPNQRYVATTQADSGDTADPAESADKPLDQ